MPPFLYTSRVKEQLTSPGIHEAKASLRSWLAGWFNKTETGQHGLCEVFILHVRFKTAPLSKTNGQEPQLFLSASPSPPKPLHGIQIKKGAVVP